MKMLYDTDIDYLEVFFDSSENYGEELSEGLTAFKRESDDKVIGYGFDSSENAFRSNFLTTAQKLAILLFVTRKKRRMSQGELSQELNIDIRQYQRLESGEYNTTLSSLDQLRFHLTDVDFSVILKDGLAS